MRRTAILLVLATIAGLLLLSGAVAQNPAETDNEPVLLEDKVGDAVGANDIVTGPHTGEPTIIGSSNQLDSLDNNTGDADGGIGHGTELSGVIQLYAVDAAVIVREESLSQQLEGAETEIELSTTIHDWVTEREVRIETLEDREQSLVSRFENGTLAEEEFRIRMAELERERSHLIRQLVDTELVVQELPAAVLEEAGIDVTEIRLLQDRAAKIGGTNASESAQLFTRPDDSEIVTRATEQRITGEQRDHRDADRYLDRASESVERANALVDRAERALGDETNRNFDRATEAQTAAEESLLKAIEAYDNENFQQTVRHATDARSAATDAIEYAEAVLDGIETGDESEADHAIETAEAELYLAKSMLDEAADVDHTTDRTRELASDIRVEYQRANDELETATQAMERNRYQRARAAAETATEHAISVQELTQRLLEIEADSPADERTAEEALKTANDAIEEANEGISRGEEIIDDENEDALAYLEDAKTALQNAQRLYSTAISYQEDADYDRALLNAEESTEAANEAIELLMRAGELVDVEPRDHEEAASDAIAKAEEIIEDANDLIVRAEQEIDDDEEALQYLEDANAEYDAAIEELQRAEEAYAAGDYEQALELAIESNELAIEAGSLARDAIVLATDDDEDDDSDVQDALDDAVDTLEKAEETIQRAESEVDEDDDEAQEYLDDAHQSFNRALQLLDNAVDAYDAGDNDEAISYAEDSKAEFVDAGESAQRAIELANE